MDIFSQQKRSEIMKKIGHKNTRPELIVRKLLSKNGYRYRLHGRHLYGNPDLYFSKKKLAIFVNGCYWHRHDECVKGKSIPSSNTKFWQKKFDSTVKRDQEVYKKLAELGWRTVIIWECETKNILSLEKKLLEQLSL